MVFSYQLLWDCFPIREKLGLVLHAEPTRMNASALLLLCETPGIHHTRLLCYLAVILHPSAFREALERISPNDTLV